jgi:hypothetical protein
VTRVLVAGALALGLLAAPAAGFAQDAGMPAPGTIRLKVAEFDPVAGVPTLPAAATLDRYPTGVRGGFLVQFQRPITAADRAALEEVGASVKGYVPMMTLEIVMTEDSRAKVATLPGVRWVGIYQPAFKIIPGLPEREASLQPGEKMKLQVSLFAGEEEPAMSDIRGLGARVLKIDRGRSFLVAQIEIPSGRLNSLAGIPQVRFVEEVYKQIALNDRSRVHTGLDDVANDTFTSGLDTSLDGNDEGSGFQVKYGHMDSGLNGGRADFSTADVTFEPGADSSDLDNGHGTHTAGSMVGDGGDYATVPENAPATGPVTADKWRGITPQAALHHISFDNNYTDRQMFERESEEGAHVSSNSWGWGNAGGSIRDYNTNAAVWDEGVWDADNDVAGLQPLVVVFSAGNDGGWNSPYNGCNSAGPDNVGSPGTAKNVITVGNNETDRGSFGACGGAYASLGDNVEEMNASSSRGPVDPDGTGQGLFKPDVTNIGGYWVASVEAPGTASACSAQYVEGDCPTPGEAGYCSNTGANYAYYNGTSMSCPLTAGLAGVLFQDLVVNRGVGSPKPSLVKALLINGARDLQPSACNYTYDVTQSTVHEGWGFVQAKDSLYGPSGGPAQRNIDFENEETANAVATGETYTRQITVASGTPFKVSVAWTDYPAAAGSGSPLVVNDLDLEVSGPSGTFRGNNFSGNWSATGGSADRYNVVENVYIQNPGAGTYTVTVRGYQVSQDQEPSKAGVNQDFSLVWSGDLGPCTSTCGNNTIECSEVCDGSDLGGESCQTQGFDDGTLACASGCGGFDTSGCFDYVCGDGVKNGTEECDGSDIGGATCASQGCTGGTPTCTGGCTLNYSTCTGCPACDNDGTCETGEDCNSCANDCISGSTSGADCGNGICEAGNGEDCLSCPADCNGKTNGKPSTRFCCGDGDGQNPRSCSDPTCSTGGWECTDVPANPSTYCCGDATCEGAEDSFNCAVDCGAPPFCGDGTCDPGEDQCSCAGDCGTPPATEEGLCSDGIDNDCDGLTDGDDDDCAGACFPLGASCTDNADCCSVKCKGKGGSKTCR